MQMNRKISQSAEQYNEQHILNEVNQNCVRRESIES